MDLRPAVLIVCISACSPVQQAAAPDSIPQLDRGMFDQCVEPVLIRNCAYTNCHANENFPLRVYAVGRLRAPGTPNTLAALTAGPLTQAEHDANYKAALALSYGGPAPADNLLIRKPLPSAAGGFEHVGGAIYSGNSDPCVLSIKAWLAGQSYDCSQGPGVCK